MWDVFTLTRARTHAGSSLIFKEPLQHFATNYCSKLPVLDYFPLICKASLIHEIVHILLSISISLIQDRNLSLLEANNYYYFFKSDICNPEMLISGSLHCKKYSCSKLSPANLGHIILPKNIMLKELGCRSQRGGILVAVSKNQAHNLHRNREASKEMVWNSSGTVNSRVHFPSGGAGETPQRRAVTATHGRHVLFYQRRIKMISETPGLPF